MRDVNVLAKTGQRLIDAVGDQLVNEMMQPLDAGVADVHAGPLADMFRVALDLDIAFAIHLVGAGHRCRNFRQHHYFFTHR